MSPFRGVYTIKCTVGRITPSSGALLQWGTCAEAAAVLFEQLAQFSPACTSAHRSERVAPHVGGGARSAPIESSRMDCTSDCRGPEQPPTPKDGQKRGSLFEL